jgi:type IV pilus assembly protein PilM
MFSIKGKQVVGLDIGSGSVKLLQLKEARKGYKLEKFGIKPIDPELIVDGTVMDVGRVVEAIKELIAEQKIKIKSAAISISGHSVIVKKIMLPLMTEDELDESIRWEAEQYIPFDINDVNIDFHILGVPEGGEAQDQMNVLLVAAKKDKLAEYTALVSEAGLEPVVVDVDAFTLENMYGINYEVREGEVVALINIGASLMNINILKGGTFSFTRDIPMGGNKYTEAIQREFNVSYEQAEQIKRGETREGFDPAALVNIYHTLNGELANEILRSIEYFKSTSANENIEKVYLSGGTARIPDLDTQLAERLGMTVELVNPFNSIEINTKEFDPEYLKQVSPMAAVAVGLAIRRVGDR